MAGTKIGAAKTVATLRARDPLHYHKLAVMGGRASSGGPLKGNPKLAREIGKLGGRPKGSVGIAKRHRPAETFFVQDETIDNHIIEPFQKESFFKGWFKRSN